MIGGWLGTQMAMQKWNTLSGEGEVLGLTHSVTHHPLSRKIGASLYKYRPLEAARVGITKFIPSLAFAELAMKARIKNLGTRGLIGAIPSAGVAIGFMAHEAGAAKAAEQAKRMASFKRFQGTLEPMNLTPEQRGHISAAFTEGLIEIEDGVAG